MPEVSVLMAVYNGERFVSQAIRSILAQTLRDFEFLIVDDGSTDRTPALLDQFARQDRRIHVHRQANQGLTVSLNVGLDLAQGRYIARLDADDVALPRRLEKQAALMDRCPEVGICGTWVRTFGQGRRKTWRYPPDDRTLQGLLIFNPPFANPATMLRRAAFDAARLRFDTSFSVAQDYELWARAAQHVRLANLPEVLVKYRVHAAQLTQQHLQKQLVLAGRVQAAQIARLGLQPTDDEFAVHQLIGQWMPEPSRAFVDRAEAWLSRLAAANRERAVYPEPEFARLLAERWLKVCRVMTHEGRWAWQRFRSSPLSRDLTLVRRTVLAHFWLSSTLGLGRLRPS